MKDRRGNNHLFRRTGACCCALGGWAAYLCVGRLRSLCRHRWLDWTLGICFPTLGRVFRRLARVHLHRQARHRTHRAGRVSVDARRGARAWGKTRPRGAGSRHAEGSEDGSTFLNMVVMAVVPFIARSLSRRLSVACAAVPLTISEVQWGY